MERIKGSTQDRADSARMIEHEVEQSNTAKKRKWGTPEIRKKELSRSGAGKGHAITEDYHGHGPS